MRKIKYIEAIAEGLTQIMSKDKNVFLMGEGVDNIRGIYGTVLPAYKKFGKKRVIDTPISENAINGIAVGAAISGKKPVVFHQRNDFLMLGLDQLSNHAAKIKFITDRNVPITIVTFICQRPGEGPQHSQSLQALFAHFPGLQVLMPYSCSDAKNLLMSAITDKNPTLVMYHCFLLGSEGDVSKEYTNEKIGSAKIIRSGKDITIVGTSLALNAATEASEQLHKKGISAEVIDLRSIRPWDTHTIAASVRKTGRLLIADIGWKSFGISAEISAKITELCFNKLKAPPERLGMKETPAPASELLLKDYLPTAKMIVSKSLKMFHP